MQSGSQATRSVADIVLLGDSFAALPAAVREGQRIRNGMQDILTLFLTRVLYVALLLLATGIIGGFPFAPTHSSLLALLTVGLPTVALAAWARPGARTRRRPVRSLLRFVLPAAVTVALPRWACTSPASCRRPPTASPPPSAGPIRRRSALPWRWPRPP
jgi:cation-transporting ATPase E